MVGKWLTGKNRRSATGEKAMGKPPLPIRDGRFCSGSKSILNSGVDQLSASSGAVGAVRFPNAPAHSTAHPPSV